MGISASGKEILSQVLCGVTNHALSYYVQHQDVGMSSLHSSEIINRCHWPII
jgi:uncharacterized protein (DUF427 family)